MIIFTPTQQELGPIEENLLAWILQKVLKGLDYLHSQRIAYGNMTTRDILFSIASGSLEIKLDHSHVAIDELDDRTVPNGNFDLNLGVIQWYRIIAPTLLCMYHILLHRLTFGILASLLLS